MTALLYSVNAMPQILNAGQTINLGMPIRRYGKNLQISGGNVAVNGEGYYPMIVNITGVAAAAGVVGVQLYENGVEIPGAISSTTVAANDTFSLTVPTAIKIKCCEEKIITAGLLTVGATISNASVLSMKA